MKAFESLTGKQYEYLKGVNAHSEMAYEMLEPLLPYYAERDRELIADRVCETVLNRQKQG